MTTHKKRCTASEKLEFQFNDKLLEATTGQNAPLESYHSSLKRVICRQYKFNSFL